MPVIKTKMTKGEWKRSGAHIYSEHGNICEVGQPRAKAKISHTPLDFSTTDREEIAANIAAISAVPDMARVLACFLIIRKHGHTKEAAKLMGPEYEELMTRSVLVPTKINSLLAKQAEAALQKAGIEVADMADQKTE